jgi:hypothetical protein
MKKGEYNLNGIFRKCMPHLELRGDDRSIVGASCVDSAAFDGFGNIFYSGALAPELGLGRNIKITKSGNTLTVEYEELATLIGQFVGMIINPTYDAAVAGDQVTIVDEDGNLTTHTVVSASGNSITLDNLPNAVACQPDGRVKKGVGFVIEPCVTLNASSAQAIDGFEDVNVLKLSGCKVKPGIAFHVAGFHSVVERNVFAGPGHFVHLGHNLMDRVYALAWNGAGSHMYGLFQCFIGQGSQFFTEVTPGALNVFSTFSGCNSGGLPNGSYDKAAMTVANGAVICVFFSDFINCGGKNSDTSGLQVDGGAMVNLQNSRYCNCGIGVNVKYNSTVSIVPIPILPWDAFDVTVTNCGIGISAYAGSIARLPFSDANMSGNDNDYSLDGVLGDSAVVLDGTMGSKGSIINHTDVNA